MFLGRFLVTSHLLALLLVNACHTGSSSNVGCTVRPLIRTKGLHVAKPRDCADVQKTCGAKESGVYKIYPRGGAATGIDVFCDLKTTGGGWTAFQRRQDGSVDFFQGWESYKHGFGDVFGEYWLGNGNLHLLTMQKRYQLYVHLEDWSGQSTHAYYSDFFIGGEHEKYKLYVSGFSGTAGDSFSGLSGMKFSTKEADHDVYGGNCATAYKGAWWYSKCHASNLNGWYYKNGHHKSFADGVNWKAFKGYHYSLKKVTMMVRPYA